MTTLVLMGVQYPVEPPKSPTMCWQIYDFLLEQTRTGKASLIVPATLLGMYIASPGLRKELMEKATKADPRARPPSIAQDRLLPASIEVSDLIGLCNQQQVAEVMEQATLVRQIFQRETLVYQEAEKSLGNSSPSHSTRNSSEQPGGGEA